MERLITLVVIVLCQFALIACANNLQKCDDASNCIKIRYIENSKCKLKFIVSKDRYFAEYLDTNNHVESFIQLPNAIPTSIKLFGDTLKLAYNNLVFPSNNKTKSGLLTYYNSLSRNLGPYVVKHEMDRTECLGSNTKFSHSFDSVFVSKRAISFYFQHTWIGSSQFEDLSFINGRYSTSYINKNNTTIVATNYIPLYDDLVCEIYQSWLTN